SADLEEGGRLRRAPRSRVSLAGHARAEPGARPSERAELADAARRAPGGSRSRRRGDRRSRRRREPRRGGATRAPGSRRDSRLAAQRAPPVVLEGAQPVGDRAPSRHAARHREVECSSRSDEASGPARGRHDDGGFLTPAMTHDQCRETLALHALGSTLAGDAAALELHLERCPACAGELAFLQETVARLALVSLPIMPSRGHLDRVLRALDAEDTTVRRAPNRSMRVAGRPPAVRQGRRWRPFVFAVRLAVAAVLVALVTSQIVLMRRLDRASRELDYVRGV